MQKMVRIIQCLTLIAISLNSSFANATFQKCDVFSPTRMSDKETIVMEYNVLWLETLPVINRIVVLSQLSHAEVEWVESEDKRELNVKIRTVAQNRTFSTLFKRSFQLPFEVKTYTEENTTPAFQRCRNTVATIENVEAKKLLTDSLFDRATGIFRIKTGFTRDTSRHKMIAIVSLLAHDRVKHEFDLDQGIVIVSITSSKDAEILLDFIRREALINPEVAQDIP